MTFFKFTNFPFLLCDDFWGFFLQQKQAMDHLKGIKVIRAFVFLGRCFWRFLFRLEKSSGLPALKKFTELRLLTRLLPTSVGPFTRRNWFAVGWPVGSPGRKSGSGDQGRCPNGSMIFSGKADVKPQWISNKCRSFHNSKVAMDGFLPRVVFVDILFCRKNGVVFTSQKVLWWKFKPFFVCVCVSLNFAITSPTKTMELSTSCRWWPIPIEFERFADPKIAQAGVRTFSHATGARLGTAFIFFGTFFSDFALRKLDFQCWVSMISCIV